MASLGIIKNRCGGSVTRHSTNISQPHIVLTCGLQFQFPGTFSVEEITEIMDSWSWGDKVSKEMDAETYLVRFT